MIRYTAKAYARAGLLGNPSDLYQGKVIAFTLADFFATATWRAQAEWEIDPRGGLCNAAWEVFQAELGASPKQNRTPFGLAFTTTIPRQVGLAGSSAIICAALRVLAKAFAHPLPPADLARLALRAETEVLGITAGPQDRLAQAYQGLLYMDFTRRTTPETAELGFPLLELAADCLPPCFVAWDPQPGKSSGATHAAVKKRWLQGESEVLAIMDELPKLADRGKVALQRHDVASLQDLVNRNFDLRARLFPISVRDQQMIELGRKLGAATKFCGSGGAILGIPSTSCNLDRLQQQYHAAGFQFMCPTLAPTLHGTTTTTP